MSWCCYLVWNPPSTKSMFSTPYGAYDVTVSTKFGDEFSMYSDSICSLLLRFISKTKHLHKNCHS